MEIITQAWSSGGSVYSTCWRWYIVRTLRRSVPWADSQAKPYGGESAK